MAENKSTSHSWSKLFRENAYDTLVVNALPLAGSEPDATRWFLRTFFTLDNTFLLQPETVGKIDTAAASGNPYALFALGRYHLCTQRIENATEKAMECFEKAWAQGITEAKVALSMAYNNGDIGIVDRLKANTLLSDALNAGCEYAAEYLLRKMLYGLCGTPADPEAALRICDELIIKDIELHGVNEVNPKWHYLKGCAQQEIQGWSHGMRDLRTAAEMGLVCAWPDLAIAASHNDKGEKVNQATYLAVIREGAVHKNATCMYFLAMSKIDDFDTMSPFAQDLTAKQLFIDLEAAYDFGSSEAAEELADMYYRDDNHETAFSWYAKGALYNSIACYEKIFKLIHDHYIDRPQDFQDMIALHGARLGSGKLLGETVMAYTYGRLTEFASEIEQLYVPVFDKEEDEEFDKFLNEDEPEDLPDDDEYPDDDGRFDAYV